MNTAEAKVAQRQKLRAERDSIAAEARKSYEASLHERLSHLPALKHAKYIAVYNPIGSEARFIQDFDSLFMLGDNLLVGFPVLRSETSMDFIAIGANDNRSVVEDPLHIFTDVDSFQVINPEEFDLVLVPGLAFDKHGNRLGYGNGYYDRYLPKLREDCLIIGIAFDEQVINEVAHGSTDYKMDYVVTPTRVISAEK